MPSEGLDTLIVALHGYVVGEASLASTLERVTTLGVEAVGADMAGLTLLDGHGRPSTPVVTDPVATALDQAQYDADVGPCLTAVRDRVAQRAVDVEEDLRWPQFRVAAVALGVRSVLSLPLAVPERAFGALNLYAREAGAFGDEHEAVGVVFAGHAAVAVGNAAAYWDMATLAGDLSTAMDSRAVIEQAKGVLMATIGCSAEDAFALLRAQSQTENRKLRDIAVEIVERQQRRN